MMDKVGLFSDMIVFMSYAMQIVIGFLNGDYLLLSCLVA